MSVPPISYVEVTNKCVRLTMDPIASIFQYCDATTLSTASSVCKLFNHVIHNDTKTKSLVWNGAAREVIDTPFPIPKGMDPKQALISEVSKRFTILDVFRSICSITLNNNDNNKEQELSKSLNIFYLLATSGAKIPTLHAESNDEAKNYFNNALKIAAILNNLNILRLAIKTGARPDEDSLSRGCKWSEKFTNPTLKNKFFELVNKPGVPPQNKQNHQYSVITKRSLNPKSQAIARDIQQQLQENAREEEDSLASYGDNFIKILKGINLNNIPLLRILVQSLIKIENPQACFNAALEKSAELKNPEPLNLVVKVQAIPDMKIGTNSFNLAIQYAFKYQCEMVIDWAYQHGARPDSQSFNLALTYFRDYPSTDIKFFTAVCKRLKRFEITAHNTPSEMNSFNLALQCVQNRDLNACIQPMIKLVSDLGGSPDAQTFRHLLVLGAIHGLLKLLKNLNITLPPSDINSENFNEGIKVVFKTGKISLIKEMKQIGLAPDETSFNVAFKEALAFNKPALLSQLVVSGVTPSENSLQKALSLPSSRYRAHVMRHLITKIKPKVTPASLKVAKKPENKAFLPLIQKLEKEQAKQDRVRFGIDEPAEDSDPMEIDPASQPPGILGKRLFDSENNNSLQATKKAHK